MGLIETEILEEHIRKTNLKQSEKRFQILDIFLKDKEHISAEELYRKVTDKHPGIGQATVYRTIKILCDCGLAREAGNVNGQCLYERARGNDHHHLICTRCKKMVELQDSRIEELKNELLRDHGFEAVEHYFELFGICPNCQDKGK